MHVFSIYDGFCIVEALAHHLDERQSELDELKDFVEEDNEIEEEDAPPPKQRDMWSVHVPHTKVHNDMIWLSVMPHRHIAYLTLALPHGTELHMKPVGLTTLEISYSFNPPEDVVQHIAELTGENAADLDFRTKTNKIDVDLRRPIVSFEQLHDSSAYKYAVVRVIVQDIDTKSLDMTF